jgi:hypothetical protein
MAAPMMQSMDARFALEESTDSDALASVSRAAYDEDDLADFGEAAPAETLGAPGARSVPSRPAAGARSLPPAGRTAPPPASPPAGPSSGSMKTRMITRKPVADDFESEEPTGRAPDLDEAMAGYAQTPEHSERAYASTPAQEGKPEPEPVTARRKSMGKPGAGAPPTTTSARYPTDPRNEALKQAAQPESASLAKARRAKHSRAVWAVIIALLAIVALLIWWLAR